MSPLYPGVTVSLDGVVFSSDPLLTPDWPRRVVYLAGVGGSGTTQDFGRQVRDLVMTLDSGDNQFLDVETARELDARYHQRGVGWPLVDTAHGIAGTFHIEQFLYRPSSLAGLVRYTMRLRAVTLTQWLGAAYPPAAP